jgi:hypothetical protein
MIGWLATFLSLEVDQPRISLVDYQTKQCVIASDIVTKELEQLESIKFLMINSADRDYIVHQYARPDVHDVIDRWHATSDVYLAPDACVLVLGEYFQAERFFLEHPEGLGEEPIREAGRQALSEYLSSGLVAEEVRPLYSFYSEKLGRGSLTLREPGKYGKLNTSNPGEDAAVGVDDLPLGPAGKIYQVLSGSHTFSMDTTSGRLCDKIITIQVGLSHDFACN